jgi:hypothetical protein
MEEKIITNMIATLTHNKEVINKVTFMVNYFFYLFLGTICYLLIVKLKKEKKNRNISVK